MLRVKIELSSVLYKTTVYVWQLFSKRFGIDYKLVDNDQDLTISTNSSADIWVSEKAEKLLSNEHFNHEQWFDEQPILIDYGHKDYFSSVFYLLNGLQEFSLVQPDQYGRFQYTSSFQYKFECVEENLVEQYFQKILSSCKKLKKAASEQDKPSHIWLTHDIDHIGSWWKSELKFALKHFQFSRCSNILFQYILGRSEWLNMEQIIQLEQENDWISTFFWLTEQEDGGNIKNADYDYHSKKIQRLQTYIKASGFENGLHKSTASTSFNQEFTQLNAAEKINRNHFLHLTLPNHWQELENAQFTLDTSVGYAHAPGFRTSYGRPYQPYSFSTKQAMQLIEAPLNIMDTTFSHYLKLNGNKAAQHTSSFLDKHRHNCVLTLLFHNNYLTKYQFKDVLSFYKQILILIKEGGYQPISGMEIVKKFELEVSDKHISAQ